MTMAVQPAVRLKPYLHAGLSLACSAVNLAATIQYIMQLVAYRAPLDQRDIWGESDLVQTLKQRAAAAALFLIGAVFSFVLLIGGSLLQAAAAYRLTQSWPTALRVFCRLELPYQAIQAFKNRLSSGEAVDVGANDELLTTLKLLEFGKSFLAACLACIVAFLSLVQRPWHTRTYVHVAMLDPVPMLTSVVLSVANGVYIAEFLGTVKWSLWRVSSSADLPKAAAATAAVNAASSESTAISALTPVVLQALTCIVSVLSHVFLCTMLCLAVRRFVIAVLVCYWLICSGVYYVSSKQALLAASCGALSVAVALPFNPSSTKRSWWLSSALTVIVSIVALILGALQAARFEFTGGFHSNYYADTNNNTKRLAVEQSVGVAMVCLAIAEVVLYAFTSLLCARSYVWDYEVEMS